MDETVLFPSPNWFQVSGVAVSRDNWLIYGGPSKSLCVLEPLPSEYKSVVSGNRGYKAHVLNRAHSDKIVSVDLSPEWPEKRSILTGSADGSVKQWSLDKVDKMLNIKSTHSHEIHSHEKEEVAGVGYSNEVFAITIGCFGNIVKWDLNSNVVKTYSNLLKGFKPVCMACSQHIPLTVAVGTKQGVIFVLDLTGLGKIVYKVRGQDDEIMNLSWCPQYEVALKKALETKETEKKSSLADRLERIRNEPEPELTEKEILEVSGVVKKLPDDSFDESIVQEDDMFDIYTDHETDEFGHKKYQPEDILVKVNVEEKKDDYLADCLKLKDEILKRKNQPEPSIQSLVEALDNTHVDEGQGETGSSTSENAEVENTSEVEAVSSVHTHKHLLATVGKHGSVRIWSKSGKLVSSCVVINNNMKNQKGKAPNWPTLLWYKPDVLIIADGKSQLLECNPLKIDKKNKLEWKVIHTLHKRGLYCIASNIPRVQSSDSTTESKELAEVSSNSSVWTISQERVLIEYCMTKRQKVAEHTTCGGFVYMIETCPYDAGKVAVSVGDGAVRVWNTSTLEDDDTKLSPGHVSTYWQNVQGKVLAIAWHPTKENLLAFATAESRVGLIDTRGKTEKPAKVLVPALSSAVYGLCWGENYDLFACGGGELVVYGADRPDEGPKPIVVQLEGCVWSVSAVRHHPRALICGSGAGAVAALHAQEDNPHHYTVVAAAFVFNKMIHCIEWHPQQTSSSNEESPYKNLIAVSSADKQNTIVILEYADKEDGGKQLTTWKTLVGHKSTVFQVTWNPHKDGLLLSSSLDSTVRVWDIESGVCKSIFSGHAASSMGLCWSALPQLASHVLSGGGDCAVRMWDEALHPAEDHQDKFEHLTRKDKRKYKKAMDAAKKEDAPAVENEDSLVAATLETYKKGSRRFLLQTCYKQMNSCTTSAPRKMLEMYLQKSSGEVAEASSDEGQYDLDFLNIFGSINDVNKLLDEELQRHDTLINTESYIMLSIFRGHIDSMIQYASQKDLLCPFLVSITPCVSFKYWKDVTQLYLAQIDRLVAKGEEAQLYETKMYGGSVYRKAATLLSVHDIKGAVATLIEASLFKEAYVLCRTRYIDSIAENTLYQWAQNCTFEGKYAMAATCYIALGNLSQAAAVLSKSKEQECLSLAADIAKAVGQNTFADQVEKKAQMKGNQVDTTEQLLEQLPSKIELLMKDVDKVQNGETHVPTNGD